MPPKGWRKNAEGQYPQPTRQEITSIDDILFPRSTIQKLAKIIMQDDESAHNMSLSKDTLVALQRSATVFVSHVLFHARRHSKSGLRKTINVQDVFGALEDAEFSGFLPDLKLRVAAFEERKRDKNVKENEKGSEKEDEKDEKDEVDDKEDEDEQVPVNPIAATSREEAELMGEEVEDVEDEEEDEDEED